MRTGTASVSELLANGGWLIDDPQRVHAENPDAFWLPSVEQLDALRVGHMVRLRFQVLDQADPILDGTDPYGANGSPQLVVAYERMWVWVEHRQDVGPQATFLGILDSLPVATHTRLRPGARVRFSATDVIDLTTEPSVDMTDEIALLQTVGFSLQTVEQTRSPEDPTRNPSIAPSQSNVCDRAGVRPERPSHFFSRLLVGNNVNETSAVIRGGRFQPNLDRRDCGWVIWADHQDMDDDAIGGHTVIDAAELQRRHPEAWKYLALPPGWGFTVGNDGFEDIYEDPDLLSDE